MKQPTHDTSLLTAAILGYELQLKEIASQIEKVKQRLTARPARTISAEGRARISEAQRKRWAEVKLKASSKRRK